MIGPPEGATDRKLSTPALGIGLIGFVDGLTGYLFCVCGGSGGLVGGVGGSGRWDKVGTLADWRKIRECSPAHGLWASILLSQPVK
jgi:hypothetical protein